MKTVEAAIETNRMQKDLMVKKMKRLVGGKFKGKQIAILGLTFKPNTDDVRDSAYINMIDMIKSEGGSIRAYDPIANESMKSIFPDLNYYTSWEDACKDADGVAIMTEWNEFRGISLSLLKSLLKSPVLLDTRNIFRDLNIIDENIEHKLNQIEFLKNQIEDLKIEKTHILSEDLKLENNQINKIKFTKVPSGIKEIKFFMDKVRAIRKNKNCEYFPQ